MILNLDNNCENFPLLSSLDSKFNSLLKLYSFYNTIKKNENKIYIIFNYPYYKYN